MVHFIGMLPIRKIKPHVVSLTSYYGKIFVRRNEKRVNDLYDWLAKQIIGHGLDDANTHITKVNPANVFDSEFVAPRIYTSLARKFKSFTIDGNFFLFDHKSRDKLFAPELLQEIEINISIKTRQTNCLVVCGISKSKEPILVGKYNDLDDCFFIYRNGAYEPIGDIFNIALVDQTQGPVESSEVSVYSAAIPIGIVLGYKLGITNLIKLLGVKPVIYEPRQRITLESHQFAIAFKDKKLVFSRKDKVASLIMGGFSQFKKSVANYFLESFDDKNVYLNVLETQGISVRYLRELDTMDQLFIDPITKTILEEMHEPVTFMGLLMRSTELLTKDYHPNPQDMNSMRIKGYERFAGAVYKEMLRGVKDFKARNIRGKSQIEMAPYAVAKNIAQDSSAKLVEDINPIQNLKESEAVTYVGEGGRSKESMDRSTRGYHESDMGMISEATVDSSDVGINSFLSANPQFSSLRGRIKATDKKLDPTTLMSTSALISPGSSHDD
jgi:hypothetical protein